MMHVWVRRGLLGRTLLLLCVVLPVQGLLSEGVILSDWATTLNNTNQLTNWPLGGASPTDPCASNPWFHVLCYAGYVIRIDLGLLGLVGTLAPKLGNLSQLQALNLYNNNFIGTIPVELGNLAALSFLDLSNNKLYGGIPATFGNLGNLSSLKLSYNNLSGSIPVELTKPPKLTTLSVSVGSFMIW